MEKENMREEKRKRAPPEEVDDSVESGEHYFPSSVLVNVIQQGAGVNSGLMESRPACEKGLQRKV